MPDDRLILALDQGGQSTRALVFDRSGRLLLEKREPVATRRHGSLMVEHDADELVSSVRQVIAAAHDEIGRSGGGIESAGLATQRSTIVCWDRVSGAALSPVISWQDRRAAQILDDRAPADDVVHRITGLVRSPHYGASKMRWCLDRIAAVADALQAGTLAMGPLSSYLLWQTVSGRPFAADPVNASRTLLWDVTTRNWSDRMLTAFGIPREVLPACTGNRHPFGLLDGYRTPLTVCTGDQSAAIFAAGRVAAGSVYINIGTGAFLLTPADSVPAGTRLLRSVVWEDDSALVRVMEGTVNGAGSAIEAIFPDPGTRPSMAAADAMIGGPAQIPLFLNGVSGLGSPFWRQDFASRFVGNGDAVTRLTAVLESIIFLLRLNLDEIAPVVHLRDIVISGGLSRNDGLCQALADLSGLPVARPDESEATARGLGCLIAGLPAQWGVASGRSFRPATRPAVHDRYARWCAELQAALDAGN